MKEFFVSAKFQMKLPGNVSAVAGGVVIPSGVPLPTLQRRDLTKKYPHLKRRLLDPQLYLVELNASTSRKACANLASYPWFPLERHITYDSRKMTQAAWRQRMRREIHKIWLGKLPTRSAHIDDTIRLTLETQRALDVEALILPAPLTWDLHAQFDTELHWIERGLSIAARVAPDLPAYVTVALSDTAVRGTDPWSNRLLDVILDQITARGITHVYLVLEQANEEGYFCTHPNTVGGLLRLCNGLKYGGAQRVLVAFAGIAGLMSLAAGADAWTSGWYRGERRLKLADFADQEGRANPAFYSHAMAGEFHMEKDLDHAVMKGFLKRIEDRTEASAELIAALRAGKSSNSVAEWAYRSSNVAASIEHFLLACARETLEMARLPDRLLEGHVANWLEGAEKVAADLYSVGSFNPRTAVNHQANWRSAFEQYRIKKL